MSTFGKGLIVHDVKGDRIILSDGTEWDVTLGFGHMLWMFGTAVEFDGRTLRDSRGSSVSVEPASRRKAADADDADDSDEE